RRQREPGARRLVPGARVRAATRAPARKPRFHRRCAGAEDADVRGVQRGSSASAQAGSVPTQVAFAQLQRRNDTMIARLLRRRPSPALVISCIELIFAMAGTSIAA